MKYRIGEIAKMLGVSAEAVRYFEKIGLIHPTRDEESGYRLYEVGEHNILMRARGYSRFGFTLAEAAELIANGDLADLTAALKGREAPLKESIRQQMLLLRCLKRRREHLDRVCALGERFRVETSPPLYGVLYRRGYEFMQKEGMSGQVREWAEKKPFAEALLVYKKETILAGGKGYYLGLCMEEEFAKAFGVDRQAGVEYFPPRKSVYSLRRIPHERAVESDLPRSFAPTLAFLKEQGLKLAGDSCGRTLHTSKKNGEYVHYCEQWFPVE